MMEKEALTHNIKDDLDARNRNWDKIDEKFDIVDNTASEVVNARGDYTTLGERLDSQKEDYANYQNDINLKIATVEKELNDYKSTMASVNVNQEAKQTASDYGIVSLPKNAANGQVGSVVKGMTIVNLLGNKGDCTNVNDFNANSGNISVDTNVFKYGTTSFKVETNSNFGAIGELKTLDPTKYYLFVASCFIQSFTNGTPTVSVRNEDYTDPIRNNFDVTRLNQWQTKAVKFTGKTSTRLQVGGIEHSVATINYDGLMLIEISVDDYNNLSTDELIIKYPYVNNTKSTPSASRLKSVGKNLFDKSKVKNNTYIEILTGKILPHATFCSSDFIKVKPNTQYIRNKTSQGAFYDINKTFISGFSSNTFTSPTNAVYARISVDMSNVESFQLEQNTVATPYEPYTESNMYLPNIGELRSLPNGTKDEIRVSGGKAEHIKRIDNDGTTELAEPIITPIQVSGTLLSNPSGTVYVEPVVADAGVYTDKMTVLHSDLPINYIEKLSKVDFNTGVETELDASQCVVAEDKLSFTHPDLTVNDIVFFTYYHNVEGTQGETTIEYYDSRHTLKDSVTGKFYKVVPTVADGVLTNQLVEV